MMTVGTVAERDMEGILVVAEFLRTERSREAVVLVGAKNGYKNGLDGEDVTLTSKGLSRWCWC